MEENNEVKKDEEPLCQPLLYDLVNDWFVLNSRSHVANRQEMGYRAMRQHQK